jgi:hypothetical protein
MPHVRREWMNRGETTDINSFMTQVAELVRLQRSWFQDSSATLWASILPFGVFRQTLV